MPRSQHSSVRDSTHGASLLWAFCRARQRSAAIFSPKSPREAPHHLRDTLKALIAVFGGARPAAAALELTKRYEEFRRGKLADLLAHYSAEEPRGEFVLIVAGAADGEVQETTPQDTPQELVARFMQEGRSKKEAMREAAKRLNLSRRDVYQTLLEE